VFVRRFEASLSRVVGVGNDDAAIAPREATVLVVALPRRCLSRVGTAYVRLGSRDSSQRMDIPAALAAAQMLLTLRSTSVASRSRAASFADVARSAFLRLVVAYQRGQSLVAHVQTSIGGEIAVTPHGRGASRSEGKRMKLAVRPLARCANVPLGPPATAAVWSEIPRAGSRRAMSKARSRT
jgi:hypothetical protein